MQFKVKDQNNQKGSKKNIDQIIVYERINKRTQKKPTNNPTEK